MGTVVALIRVMPEDPSVDLGDLKRRIEASMPTGITLRAIQEKPIAFGLRALNVTISMPDGLQGGTEQVEEALRKLPRVQSVETTDVGLL